MNFKCSCNQSGACTALPNDSNVMDCSFNFTKMDKHVFDIQAMMMVFQEHSVYTSLVSSPVLPAKLI